MDAVTYPAEEVQEIAKSFVCVRIEVDQEKNLTKKFGVKSLTDIRLLDPEGKELDRLIGYTSAAKLTSRAKDALDRLSGKAVARKKGSSFSAKPVAVYPERLHGAVRKGVAYLRGAFKEGWRSAEGFSPDDLVLFAWASSGMEAKDEDLVKLHERVITTPLSSIYQASLRALALARLDPGAHRDEIKDCMKFLVGSQLESGQWTYHPSTGEGTPKIGDHSNTAFGLLGLAAAQKAGVPAPKESIAKALECWEKTQNADGGWGYRTDRETQSYASMTENGISSLLLASRLFEMPAGRGKVTERAMKWLGEHFSVAENMRSAYQEGRLAYHLYALERTGSLQATSEIAGHDWFREGAGILLANQRENGSWDDGADTPVPNTALALLFLTCSTEFLK